MQTKYIKVKAIIRSYNEELSESEDLILTRKSINQNYRQINFDLNRHLAMNGVIDLQAFQYSGKLLAEDWILYLHDDDGISSNVKSIIPVYLGVENHYDFKATTIKQFDNFMNKELLNTYLYIKVESEEEVRGDELKSLLDYISGQLSDGWGEGFEQINFTILMADDNEGRSYSVTPLECSVSFDSEVNKFEIVDKVNRE